MNMLIAAYILSADFDPDDLVSYMADSGIPTRRATLVVHIVYQWRQAGYVPCRIIGAGQFRTTPALDRPILVVRAALTRSDTHE